MMSISHSQDRSRLRRGVERDDRGRDTLFFFRMKTIGKLAKSIGKTIFSCQTWWFTGDFVLNQSSHSLSHVLRHAVQHFWWHGRFSRTRSAALASHVSWSGHEKWMAIAWALAKKRLYWFTQWSLESPMVVGSDLIWAPLRRARQHAESFQSTAERENLWNGGKLREYNER